MHHWNAVGKSNNLRPSYGCRPSNEAPTATTLSAMASTEDGATYATNHAKPLPDAIHPDGQQSQKWRMVKMRRIPPADLDSP